MTLRNTSDLLRTAARARRTLVLAGLAFLLAGALHFPAARADDTERILASVLSSTESFFQSLKARDDPGTWQRLTARSRGTIVDETYEAIRKSGDREITKEAVRRDFEAGGPLAKSYWNGFLEHFDPDAALERSRWEKGTIGSDRAEVLIFHKGSEKPAVVKLFREEGAWKVGLVETFWGRR